MKIDIKSLRPVEISDRDAFAKKIKDCGYDVQSSDFSFANIYMYQKAYGYQFVDIGDRIVVYEEKNRLVHYPIGKWTTPKELAAISDSFVKAGLSDGYVYDVPEDFLDRHPDCDGTFDIEYDEGMIDYMFSVDKTANGTGPKLRKKYNLVKQFQSSCPHAQFKTIDSPETYATALELIHKMNSECEQCQFIDEENEAMARGFKHAKELGLSGVILYAEPEYQVGIAVYSMLDKVTAIIHYEKAYHAVKGANQQLTKVIAEMLMTKEKAKFMNRQKDYNNDELRRTKRNLDPERFFKRYYLKKR